MKNRIIKTNDKTYYVLEKVNFEDKVYVLLTECDLDKDEINTDKFIIKEVSSNNGSLELESLTEEKFLTVAPLLLQRYREKQA